jgi:hypothetical protein
MFALRRLGFFAIAVFVALLIACSKPPAGVSTAKVETQPPDATAVVDGSKIDEIRGNLCPDPAPCGDNCSNTPYVENDCWTTVHGPAAANIVISASDSPQASSNMLLCDSGPYALCFFSGPPDATPTDSDNNALPCVVDESGKTANCSCQYYGSGTSFVDINGIINQNAYYEAVQECGHDGAKCANIAACGSGPKVSTTSCGMKEATVCQYVRGQNAQSPDQSLVPGYDAISTFSLAMAAGYNMKQVTDCSGPYLGCMTAPCTFPEGVTTPEDGSIVQCQCPIATGPFQIGQSGDGVQCGIPLGSDGTRYLWSAARTVVHGDPKEKIGG